MHGRCQCGGKVRGRKERKKTKEVSSRGGLWTDRPTHALQITVVRNRGCTERVK